MSDLISRQTAIEAMRELPHEYNTKEQRARTGGIVACQMIIRELPSVTPQPNVGHWIDVDSLDGALWHECSECGETEFYATDYCPNCGARMEVEE